MQDEKTMDAMREASRRAMDQQEGHDRLAGTPDVMRIALESGHLEVYDLTRQTLRGCLKTLLGLAELLKEREGTQGLSAEEKNCLLVAMSTGHALDMADDSLIFAHTSSMVSRIMDDLEAQGDGEPGDDQR